MNVSFESEPIMLHAGCGEQCALDSFVDFGAVYIVRLFTSFVSPLVLFSSLFRQHRSAMYVDAAYCY